MAAVTTYVDDECPICSEHARRPVTKPVGDAAVDRYRCSQCGDFGLSYVAQGIKYCGEDKPQGVQGLSDEQRARLSREIQKVQDDKTTPVLTSSAIEEFIITKCLTDKVPRLP